MKSHLEERFAAESNAYEALKKQMESAVRHWRYAKKMLWSYHPEQVELLTKEEVSDPKDAEYEYGYDEHERIVSIRKFRFQQTHRRNESGMFVPVSTGKKALESEEFIRHQDGAMEISSFSLRESNTPPQTLRGVAWVRMENNQIVEKAELRSDAFEHDTYAWDNGQVKLQHAFDANGRLELEIVKEPGSEPKFFKVRKDGSRFLLGQPMPKGVTVKSLIDTVRRRLLEAIPQTAMTCGINEPVYCLALAYDGEGNDVLGPYLGFGLESEREKWVAEHGKDAWQFIWNPAEFKNYEKPHTQLDDDELEEASEWLNGALSERSPAPAIKLMLEVAAELEKLDWSKTLNITPDFVVYAVDFELGDLRKNLKKIVATQKLGALKAAKLI